jgi:hypothetical protein
MLDDGGFMPALGGPFAMLPLRDGTVGGFVAIAHLVMDGGLEVWRSSVLWCLGKGSERY